MKRVAIQVISTGGFYGAERALLELATYLSAQGWDSRIIALEGGGGPELVRRASATGIHATSFSDGRRLGAPLIVKRLRAALAGHSQAIVHSHGYKPDILLGVLGTPRKLGCIATCHSWYSDTAKMRVFERLDKRLLRRFDHVVAVSNEIRADLVANGVAPEKVSMIENGISAPVLDPSARQSVRNEFGLAADDPLIVQIGRLARSKRNDLLLEAVSRLSGTLPAKVLFVGEGGERQALLEKADALGIASRIIFCGYRSDAQRILAAADMLAVTSSKEGLPIVILEAMAIGCPVVSTAVGQIPQTLECGKSGWIIPADDVEALVQALTERFQCAARAQEKAENARRSFSSRFARDVMGSRYVDLYERMWAARAWR